ncbi:stimulated by retinoic acid gene 6 protein-like [Candoia aspera]|uniref:stimulated by retinoic acid gene 6 protein-like n=1 Tax=Candoia aspera TaxID=51853 RepID=UPI002FD7E83E
MQIKILYFSSCFFNREDLLRNFTCQSSVEAETFLHFSLVPSVIITLLLSCLEKRTKRCCFDEKCPKCAGYCGLLIPLDSGSVFSNRWSLGFAFGVTADKLMFLFEKNYVPEEFPGWAKVFWILLVAFEMGISSYPFFVCLSTKHEIIGAILGFLYTASWSVVMIVDIIECPEGDVVGEYSNTILMWPSLLCHFFLLGRFLFMFVKAVRIRSKFNLNEEDSFLEEHQLQYVQQLLRKPLLGQPQKNWIQRKLYQWDPYFKFPNRIISTVVVLFICLYMFVVTEFLMAKILILKPLRNLWTNFKASLSVSETTEPWIENIEEFIDVVQGVWIVTVVISAVTCTGYVFHILTCYRKHIKLLRAGRKYLLLSESMKVSSSQSVVALSKFISFQTAHIMWGYLIIHLVQWVFGMVLMYILILPMKHGQWMQLWNKWATVILTFVIILLIKKMQVIVAGRFFLQPKLSPSDSQKPFALDNRKVFINFSYFLFFHSVVVGLTSCLIRLLRSIILGAWLVGRMDRPVMPKGYEHCDSGFSVWVGMLFLDHYHLNPILVCFCHILGTRLKEKYMHTPKTLETGAGDKMKQLYRDMAEDRYCQVPRMSGKARTRWLLLYTLLNNPSLQKIRKLRSMSHSVDSPNHFSVL